MKKLDKFFALILFVLLMAYGTFFMIYGKGIPCLIKKFTGFYCPGCGISRMILSILKFDFYQAFRYNPYIFILLIVVSIFALIDLIMFIKSKRHPKISNYVYITFLVSIVLYGILRNIPAFSYLLPTIVK